MSSLKYLGKVSLIVLLSTPISARFQHMDMYRDMVSDTSASPIIKKSFYLKVGRHDAFRGLPECMADIPAKPSLQSCAKTRPLPFSADLFEETVGMIESCEFVISPTETQPETSLLSFGYTEQLKTDDVPYKSVKSRIESWPRTASLPLAPITETIKLDEDMAFEPIKSRIEFWSKTGPLFLAHPQPVDPIVLDKEVASEVVSSLIESQANPIPLSKPLAVVIDEDAKEMAEEMYRIFRLGVNTLEALMISKQVDEKCKPKELRGPELLKARLFRRAFFEWSQKHLFEIYIERGKKWRMESPRLDSLFQN